MPGVWSVWSAAAESPGAYFVVPADDTARAAGFKYAVIRALNEAANPKTELTLIRTDPRSNQ